MFIGFPILVTNFLAGVKRAIFDLGLSSITDIYIALATVIASSLNLHTLMPEGSANNAATRCINLGWDLSTRYKVICTDIFRDIYVPKYGIIETNERLCASL